MAKRRSSIVFEVSPGDPPGSVSWTPTENCVIVGAYGAFSPGATVGVGSMTNPGTATLETVGRAGRMFYFGNAATLSEMNFSVDGLFFPLKAGQIIYASTLEVGTLAIIVEYE